MAMLGDDLSYGGFKDAPEVDLDRNTKAQLVAALTSAEEKVEHYREGMESLRGLLLSALGAEDVPGFYEDKTNADLAAEVTLMIRKTSEQATDGLDQIKGAACHIAAGLIKRHLDEIEIDDVTATDLTELAVEMVIRSKGDKVPDLALREAVNSFAPILREHGYYPNTLGSRRKPTREQIIEAVKALIRRRVTDKAEGKPQQELPLALDARLKEFDPRQDEAKAPKRQPVKVKCRSCNGTGIGDYPWECNGCGGSGKVRA